jgi:hypothetical protein
MRVHEVELLHSAGHVEHLRRIEHGERRMRGQLALQTARRPSRKADQNYNIILKKSKQSEADQSYIVTLKGRGEELGDGTTTYLIERAPDEARAQQFRLPAA